MDLPAGLVDGLLPGLDRGGGGIEDGDLGGLGIVGG
jgi:hypothetical protein